MKNSLISGCVDIWLDEIVPCLKDTETGEIKEIQGLVGVKNDTEVNARICIGLAQPRKITSMHLEVKNIVV